MRRAQLIGLVGIVVASGLWATPAVGQTSEPWVLWAVSSVKSLGVAPYYMTQGARESYMDCRGLQSRVTDSVEPKFRRDLGDAIRTSLNPSFEFVIDLSEHPLAGVSEGLLTFRYVCFPASVDPRPPATTVPEIANAERQQQAVAMQLFGTP